MNFDYTGEGSNEKIKLNIYDESLADSLFADDIDFIVNDIKKPEYTVEITMQEFVEAVMADRYFTCGVYEDDWKEQQIIALDFVNDKDGYPQITIKKAVSILKNVGIQCCFIYHTENHQKEYTKYGFDYPARDRFRIILLSDETITDSKKCKKIIDELLSLFKQHDIECNDLERVLHGTSESAGLYANKVYSRTFDHKIAHDLYEKNIQRKKDKKKALSNILNASSNIRSLSLQDNDDIFNMDVNAKYKDLPYIQITFAKNGDEVLKLKHAEFLKFWKEKVHYFFVKDKSYEDTHIYIYSNGVYKLRDEIEVKTLIIHLLPDILKKSAILNELYKMLQYDDTKYVQQIKLNPERYINFQNGLYDLVSGKMEVHGPDVLSTIQLSIEYIPNHNFISQYSGGTFDTYMNHFLGSDKSQIQLMLEFLGMALSNVQAHKFKKALLIIGPGNTGKSQILRFVEMLLGTENTYFCGLNKLENSRFETSNLYGVSRRPPVSRTTGTVP